MVRGASSLQSSGDRGPTSTGSLGRKLWGAQGAGRETSSGGQRCRRGDPGVWGQEGRPRGGGRGLSRGDPSSGERACRPQGGLGAQSTGGRSGGQQSRAGGGLGLVREEQPGPSRHLGGSEGASLASSRPGPPAGTQPGVALLPVGAPKQSWESPLCRVRSTPLGASQGAAQGPASRGWGPR